ncbi:uncharacterized protein K460DRAFT_6912 [Cucurbitaria berberidis CBS 394.84]|uniref:Uncharacterized protein n=1 Tax=Cucurbitaria berberidis CBS 394.84 TaxID=1168544 RepID=A0A9P4GQN0_9PLEO|nr:uncharacterized protein K460DRAFT_6912 [Cucurbitaria berberidis CBS 394.84]KAF1849930.1 hypothetical protein K460DRAFT_6912 [Cucurbitaria berberidis CBS 394.84]
MRILINEEMKKADILGKITFSSRPKALQDEPLRAVIETAKRELRFLKDTGVEGKRLDELLLARAMINNSNEKHNVFMVKVGKVHRRAGAPMPAPPPTSTTTNVEGEVFQPDLAGHEPTPVVTIPRSASRDRQPTHRPSVLAASLNDLGIGEHADATPQEDRLLIQNPDHQAAAAPTFNLDMFHPTAFLIRVVNSTTGAAVHTSQLIPTSRRGSMIAIDDMSFDRFIELVSAQVGFDVQARTSAIMPRGGSIGPSDSKVKLVSEDSWKAVLYIVHNARMRTCEFVVEERGVEG